MDFYLVPLQGQVRARKYKQAEQQVSQTQSGLGIFLHTVAVCSYEQKLQIADFQVAGFYKYLLYTSEKLSCQYVRQYLIAWTQGCSKLR